MAMFARYQLGWPVGSRRRAFGALAMFAIGVFGAPAQAAKFQDPLDSAARRFADIAALARQPIMALAPAGKRIVAVGLRGLIIFSDDQGLSWRQAAVPVQSDLLSVVFVNDKKGWAVGHEGVILATDDGGSRWIKQFDGRQAQQQLVAHYQRHIDAGKAGTQKYLDQVKLNTQAGPSLPYLDVYFENEHIGYAVGSFGMIVKTFDGGKSWLPWLEHVDNDEFSNLNAIREVGGRLFIAGEKGSIFRLEPAGDRFARTATGYQGSFFGIDGDAHFVVSYGLRGTAYRSADAGATWQLLRTGTSNTITGGMVTSKGQLILVNDGGSALSSVDGGKTFASMKVPATMQFTAVAAAGDQALVFTGQQGIARMPRALSHSTTGTQP
jgi:photosystem II stability/assembly factor-like uncharacterized protein